MKVQATLEFDLEDEGGNPIRDRGQFCAAADEVERAIRHRLLGNGFLAEDQLIGVWTLDVRITDDAIGETEPRP